MRSILVAIAFCWSCSTNSPPPAEDTAMPDTTAESPQELPLGDAPKVDPAMISEPESIGSASCAEDGTITLVLRAEDGKGAVGDGMLVYPTGHEKYGEIAEHLGGIKPGESKPVRPWKN